MRVFPTDPIAIIKQVNLDTHVPLPGTPSPANAFAMQVLKVLKVKMDKLSVPNFIRFCYRTWISWSSISRLGAVPNHRGQLKLNDGIAVIRSSLEC